VNIIIESATHSPFTCTDDLSHSSLARVSIPLTQSFAGVIHTLVHCVKPVTPSSQETESIIYIYPRSP